MTNWLRFTNFTTVRNMFLFFALLIIGLSGYMTNNLVKEMAEEERMKMQLWAAATSQIASANDNTDFSFCLRVIEDNKTIPVIIIDEHGRPYQHRNIETSPEHELEIPASRLYKLLKQYGEENEPIEIKLDENVSHFIYYGDSLLLQKLAYYPIFQWALIILFVVIFFAIFVGMKKAEQDRVWVGLSKETAHQLGTPISSLMAWVELLKGMDVPAEVSNEIEKDVLRLQTIAQRFSKVGSKPELSKVCLNEVIDKSLGYMRGRVSKRIEISSNYSNSELMFASLNVPLFEWVIENLIKNAVDAMETGEGSIKFDVKLEDKNYIIDVRDTGKGIESGKFKKVFAPGFTTKSRGWGLGLSLAKRIVEEYHKGQIFVKESEVGVGTTFRIILPLAYNNEDRA